MAAPPASPAVPPVPRLALALTVLLTALGLVVIWAPPVTPGLDTPHNLVAAWISAHPETYRGWFEPNWPIAVIMHRALLGVAFLVVSPFGALTLARSAELLIMALGALALVRRLGASIVVIPLCIAACFGWFHLMGYLNFTFAVAIVPWAIACLRDGATRRDAWWLAILCLLITESHTFIGAGIASIIAVAALCHLYMDRPSDPAPARAALFAAAPAFALVGLTVATAVGQQPEFETRASRVTTIVEDLAALQHSVFGGYSPLGGPLAALAVTIALVSLWSGRRARTLRWWVSALSLASLLAYFAAPMDGFGWLFLKPRFLPFAFLVAALPARLPPRAGKALSAAAVALTAAHLAFFGVRSTRAGRRVAETIASFGREAPGVMLPVVFDGRDGQEPPANLGALTYTYAYALLNGPGAAPLLFAQNPALHHALLAPEIQKRIPRRPNPWAHRWLDRRELADDAALHACAVDSVVLIGAAPEDRARLEARGLHFTSPALGRPSCGRGVLRISRGSAPVRVQVGYAETQSWLVDAQLQAPSATLELQLPPGDVDLALCAPEGCAPKGRTLVTRKLTIAPGGTFQEALEGP